MKPFILCLLAFAIITWSPLLAGQYEIGKDEGGIFCETDEYGGWYINKEDLRHFSIGEKGTYKVLRNSNGYFIKFTDKKKKFFWM